MKIDTRLLNLFGLLVIVAVLGLGTVTFALPMLDQVQESRQQISDAESLNQNYEMKLVELRAAEERRAEIESTIASLRKDLPPTQEAETILLTIEHALAEGAGIAKSEAFSEPGPFAPRTDPSLEGEDQGAAAPAESAPAAPPSDAESESTDSEASAEAVPTTPPADPRQQFEITLEIAVQDEPQAVALLDLLRTGQRSLLITSAELTKEEDSELGTKGKLTVTMLAFFMTGDDA